MNRPRPNQDVVNMRSKPRLLPLEIASMRLRGLKDRTETDKYYREANLFGIMLENGPEWAKYYAENRYEDTTGYSDEKFDRTTYHFARTMVRSIQEEYDISLSDIEIGQMFGISHDIATLALGRKIAVPNAKRRRGRKPKLPVMHATKVREYAKPILLSDETGAAT